MKDHFMYEDLNPQVQKAVDFFRDKILPLQKNPAVIFYFNSDLTYDIDFIDMNVYTTTSDLFTFICNINFNIFDILEINKGTNFLSTKKWFVGIK